MKKNSCVLFILKNDEKFLIDNIEKLHCLSENFDILFVIRESKDHSIEILNSNNFHFIDLAYDSGYVEALATGLEFIYKFNYETIIEFGEIGNVSIEEIPKLYNVHKSNDNKIVFVHQKNKKSNKSLPKMKLFILMTTLLKIKDPYKRIKVFDKEILKCIRVCFDNKMEPYNFILLLYLNKNNFIDVGIFFDRKTKLKYKQILFILSNRFSTLVYTLLITPFIKKFKINKCSL